MDLNATHPLRLNVFPWLKGLPELGPDEFPWNESEMDNSWLCSGGRVVKLPKGWVALGWISAAKLRVRPKTGCIAVKFNDGERDFWQHIIV